MKKTLYSFPKYTNINIGLDNVPTSTIDLQPIKPSSSLIDFGDQQQIGNIKAYLDEGFEHMATVYLPMEKNSKILWNFKDMNSKIFSKKEGWVYIITLNGDVYKIGCTGTRLGIKVKKQAQPKADTDNRIGRYRRDFTNYAEYPVKIDTDQRIRTELQPHLENGAEVCFYAKCYSNHSKSKIELLEQNYIRDYLNINGKLPLGNREIG